MGIACAATKSFWPPETGEYAWKVPITLADGAEGEPVRLGHGARLGGEGLFRRLEMA
jgi:hypothetical protein